MRNFWLVAWHEYGKRVRKRSFLLATLGIPTLVVVIMAISIIVSVGGDWDKPLGYVDHAGVLSAAVYPERDEESLFVEMRPFADEAAARAALENGEIQAYYVLPADYLQTRRISFYYWDEVPGGSAREDFQDFLRANLAADLPAEIRQRVVERPDLIVRSLDDRREFDSNSFISFIFPFAISFFFYFVVMSSAGYHLQIVADEKENRTMELMITSLSPIQLVSGKALGLMAVSLTQVLIWVVTIAAGLFIGGGRIDMLQNVKIPWDHLRVSAAFFFPAYALVAGLMTTIGSAVSDVRHGQQIASVLNLFFLFPFFFIALIFAQPDSPILVALTLFPTTAFITVTLRWGASIIPFWQLAVGWTLLVLTAAFSVWAAARVLRMGMLMYGKDLKLHDIITAVRPRRA
ncbi:MAG: ABC transporter permease [Anaerolineae bacterium]